MSEKKRLLINTLLITLGNFGAKMISFLLLPLYTSILTPAEYGDFDFVVAVSAFLLPVITLSMHEAMFRYIIDTGSEDEEFKRIITNSFVVVMAGIVLMAISMLVIAPFLDADMLLYVFVYVAANAVYVFANNMLRGLGRIREFAIVSSSKNILQLVLNVLAVAVFRWGMKGLLFSLCVSEMLAFLVVACVSKMWRQIKWRYIEWERIKPMLSYSLPLIPNTLCSQIINLSDRLVISGFMGSAANGIYSVSYKFPNMIDTLYHLFYTAWSESASRVFAKGKEYANKYYQSLYETIDGMMFAVILLMTAGMPILFRVFVRGDYLQGFYCVPLLLFAMYFACVAKFYSGIYTALKKTKVMANSTVFAAIVNIVVNLIFIKSLGLYAAAGSTLLADIVLAAMRKKNLAKDIVFKTNYKKIVARSVVVFIVISLYSYSNWVKVSVSVIIAMVYAMVENKKVISNIINKVRSKLK